MNHSRRKGSLGVIAIIVVDQLTKALAHWFLPLCERSGCSGVEVLGPVGFLRVRNEGSAFGFLPGLDIWTLLALGGLALVPLVLTRGRTTGGRLGAMLLLAGGVANLIDRIAWGGVTDFIDPGAVVVFNLADVVLAVGCVLATRALLSPEPDKAFARV